MEQGLLHVVSTLRRLAQLIVLIPNQILNPRVLVVTVAFPAPRPSNTKVEYALGYVLATSCLPCSNNSTDG